MNRLAALAVGTLSLSLAGAGPATTQSTTQSMLIYENAFTTGLNDFRIEQERPARVEAVGGALTIDTPAGITVWLNRKLTGPVVIEYDATAIQAGGPNDRVSDLNCFWMADDPTHPGGLFAKARTGKFADYDDLTTYYVGYGGNTNTTTRFRRYIGQPGNRPLRPQDEFKDASHLLRPNTRVHIRLVADGDNIEFWRDGERLFQLKDPAPYRTGFFGFRTTASHLKIENLRITRGT